MSPSLPYGLPEATTRVQGPVWFAFGVGVGGRTPGHVWLGCAQAIRERGNTKGVCALARLWGWVRSVSLPLCLFGQADLTHYRPHCGGGAGGGVGTGGGGGAGGSGGPAQGPAPRSRNSHHSTNASGTPRTGSHRSKRLRRFHTGVTARSASGAPHGGASGARVGPSASHPALVQKEQAPWGAWGGSAPQRKNEAPQGRLKTDQRAPEAESGWRDSNPRPLRPEYSPPSAVTLAGWRKGRLAASVCVGSWRRLGTWIGESSPRFLPRGAVVSRCRSPPPRHERQGAANSPS
ncbi:hypothetical protein H4W33_005243 [Kibdelosporangium phytohabitans]|nr:hypothetical protein [Kibdelosporangium phytohabitans]